MTRVQTVGTFVPPDFSGTVFSVHDHAINIRDAREYRLISIVDRAVDLTGLSVLVPKLATGANAGMGASSISRRLEIHDAAVETMEWVVRTPRFSGSVEEITPGAEPAKACRLLREIRNLLREVGTPDGLYSIGARLPAENAYARKALTILSEPGKAVLDSRLSLSRRLAGLVGLGPGFTPSGDDFICGALMAAELLGYSGALGPTLIHETERRPILERVTTTTLAGASLLTLACRASFPAHLVAFADAFSRYLKSEPRSPGGAEPPRAEKPTDARDADIAVRNAVRDVLSHGATSGSDALSGFLWMASSFLSNPVSRSQG